MQCSWGLFWFELFQSKPCFINVYDYAFLSTAQHILYHEVHQMLKVEVFQRRLF